MKTILFVRHGKSSWEDNVSDKDRTLKQRGIDDAHLVSNALKSSNTGIDYVFSSPANRALHTCIIFTRNLNLDLNKLQLSEALYDFSGEQVLDFLTRVNDDYNTILVFGHNYALTTLVNNLGDRYIENVPTAGLTKIEFKVASWQGITKGKTVEVIFPKDIR